MRSRSPDVRSRSPRPAIGCAPRATPRRGRRPHPGRRAGIEEPAETRFCTRRHRHPPPRQHLPASRAASLAAAPIAEPAHVSEEPELVRESAEPGAEEGAGAGITVIEPWAGYGRLNAKDVIDRARTASVAELAAMRLYEARHRARQTVLAAVDRQLRLANGGRPA